MPTAGEITLLLERARTGDTGAARRVFKTIHSVLRRMAAGRLKNEPDGHTFSPTDLVHETYLRVFHNRRVPFQNRCQFYGIASEAMRLILVDHARKARRDSIIPLIGDFVLPSGKQEDILAVNEALERLRGIDERLTRMIEMKHLAGMKVKEIASTLNMSVRDVERKLEFARAWLRHELG